jgi:hypothetical protein
MKKIVRGTLSKGIRRNALAIVVGGILAVTSVHAEVSKSVVLVGPTDLPEAARLPGDAMFLYDAKDGRTVLYVEQKRGAQLAAFDVTDPSHVKSQGVVRLDAAGPFDFVSSLGSQREIIRYRQDQTVAVLDFHRATSPSLTQLSAPNWQGPIFSVGANGLMANRNAEAAREVSAPENLENYKFFDATRLNSDAAFSVKQVRATVANQDTGTTFLATGEGLYLVRQLAAESAKKRRDEDWFWQHNGF